MNFEGILSKLEKNPKEITTDEAKAICDECGKLTEKELEMIAEKICEVKSEGAQERLAWAICYERRTLTEKELEMIVKVIFKVKGEKAQNWPNGAVEERQDCINTGGSGRSCSGGGPPQHHSDFHDLFNFLLAYNLTTNRLGYNNMGGPCTLGKRGWKVGILSGIY